LGSYEAGKLEKREAGKPGSWEAGKKKKPCGQINACVEKKEDEKREAGGKRREKNGTGENHIYFIRFIQTPGKALQESQRA
jgi:hypothetical protein